MELALVFIIALLVLSPQDFGRLASLLGKIFSWKRHWQRRAQALLHTLEHPPKQE